MALTFYNLIIHSVNSFLMSLTFMQQDLNAGKTFMPAKTRILLARPSPGRKILCVCSGRIVPGEIQAQSELHGIVNLSKE